MNFLLFCVNFFLNLGLDNDSCGFWSWGLQIYRIIRVKFVFDLFLKEMRLLELFWLGLFLGDDCYFLLWLKFGLEEVWYGIVFFINLLFLAIFRILCLNSVVLIINWEFHLNSCIFCWGGIRLHCMRTCLVGEFLLWFLEPGFRHLVFPSPWENLEHWRLGGSGFWWTTTSCDWITWHFDPTEMKFIINVIILTFLLNRMN